MFPMLQYYLFSYIINLLLFEVIFSSRIINNLIDTNNQSLSITNINAKLFIKSPKLTDIQHQSPVLLFIGINLISGLLPKNILICLVIN